MTNQEILEKAITKAKANGYDLGDFSVDGEYVKWKIDAYNNVIRNWESVVFSHDFAKALWGEKLRPRQVTTSLQIVEPAWEYHLQQMVIAADPAEYLSEHI